MRLHTILSLLFGTYCFAAGQITGPHAVSYVESSTGLQTMALDGGRTEIEIADINNDGHPDLLSIGDHGSPFVNTQQHGIMVWFGNGTAANWNLFQNGNFGYGGIGVGDVNNDGLLDVGYGMHHNYSGNDFGDQLLEVALGNGTGMTWTPWDDSLASQGETWGMFTTDFADIDNDGLLDVGSVSFGCCAGVHVYKNLGTGTWRQTFGFLGGNSQMEFAFGDINGDGNADFATSQQYGAVYFGNGMGNFSLAQGNLPPLGNLGLSGISLGDINNDGRKDIAFIVSGGVQVWMWDSAGQSWLNRSANLPTSGRYSVARLYDMNVDGFVDVVAFGAGLLTVWAGDGGTSWTQIASLTTHASPGSYSAIAIGDLDHNGYPDIVLEAMESCGIFCTRNIIRLFKEASVPSALTISPIFPRGGEKFKGQSVQFLDWISSVPADSMTLVRIELSTAGSNGPWAIVADSLPNNGRYQWRVPVGVNSTTCHLRYTVRTRSGLSVSAITPRPFTIVGTTTVTAPTQFPAEFRLEQNHPNPFNPSTRICYSVRHLGYVSLKVFDVLGREVATLVDDVHESGFKAVEFDGSSLPSGVYFYRLTSGSFSQTKRMSLLR